MAGEVRRRRLRALVARAGADLDIDALDAAFVHESAFREGLAERSNERLEFLGDALLGFVVARALYERYPDASQGELTLRKAALVSDAALAETAERLEFEPLLRLGAKNAGAGASPPRSALSDAFEAFLAALYHEAGVEVVAAFVGREHLAVHESDAALDNPKTILQEWSQRRFAGLPAYVERFEGPPHQRVFFSEVAVAGDVLAAGSGPSKRAAQRQAAARALEVVRERFGDLETRSYSAAHEAPMGSAPLEKSAPTKKAAPLQRSARSRGKRR
jgi:ribonuclease-3